MIQTEQIRSPKVLTTPTIHQKCAAPDFIVLIVELLDVHPGRGIGAVHALVHCLQEGLRLHQQRGILTAQHLHLTQHCPQKKQGTQTHYNSALHANSITLKEYNQYYVNLLLTL